MILCMASNLLYACCTWYTTDHVLYHFLRMWYTLYVWLHIFCMMYQIVYHHDVPHVLPCTQQGVCVCVSNHQGAWMDALRWAPGQSSTSAEPCNTGNPCPVQSQGRELRERLTGHMLTRLAVNLSSVVHASRGASHSTNRARLPWLLHCLPHRSVSLMEARTSTRQNRRPTIYCPQY